jgi:2-haloacid dehalogenase
VTARREGLPSVWLNRRHDRPGWRATPEPTERWAFDLRFDSMADLADAVDATFRGK